MSTRAARTPLPLVTSADAPVSENAIDWSEFYDRLHAFVAARVRVASDVDDLVHFILERAIQKSTGTEIEHVAGWLFGVARHAIADYYRGQARTLVAAADDLEATSDPVGSSEAERAQVLACMGPLLDTLEHDDAQILRWADMEGRSLQSIADELEISLTAAKSRAQRARKEFMKGTRKCCAIIRDARGRVVELAPHPISKALECAAAAGCSIKTSKNRRNPS